MPCMDNADCPGGAEVNVSAGFWRDTLLRENLIACYEADACLGGYIVDQEYPVACAEGYQGYLCQDCIYTET